MTTYTIKLEVLKRGRIADLWRKVQDKLRIPIRPRILTFDGSTGDDSASSLIGGALELAESKNYWVIRVQSVAKGMTIKSQ